MKEWFKSKPYWLRGGIISIIIYILLSIILLLFLSYSSQLWIFPSAIGALPAIYFLIIVGILDGSEVGSKLALIVSIIFSFIIYFGIGAFIGWIVGKTKSRKVE